jgi:hypothetical protein
MSLHEPMSGRDFEHQVRIIKANTAQKERVFGEHRLKVPLGQLATPQVTGLFIEKVASLCDETRQYEEVRRAHRYLGTEKRFPMKLSYNPDKSGSYEDETEEAIASAYNVSVTRQRKKLDGFLPRKRNVIDTLYVPHDGRIMLLRSIGRNSLFGDANQVEAMASTPATHMEVRRALVAIDEELVGVFHGQVTDENIYSKIIAVS